MPRFDQRRLPLLVVLVAVLGVLGVVVADGWSTRGDAAASEAVAEPVHDDVQAGDAARADVGTRATPSVTTSTRGVAQPVERAGFVQLAADHMRPVAQAAPALLVLAALFTSVATAQSVVATVAAVVPRPMPLAHVRRRGPPALAVV